MVYIITLFYKHYPHYVHKHNKAINTIRPTHCSPARRPRPAGNIRIGNQFLIIRALHFAQPQAYMYHQASVTITLGRRI